MAKKSERKRHSKIKEQIGTFGEMSLNAQEGRTVNEVEKLLMLTKRLIEEKIDSGAKGMVMNKDTDNPVKVKYDNALRTCDRLFAYMGVKGAFSFGICKTCSHFDKASSATGMYGKCAKSKNLMHLYDTCDQHSRRGGGHGTA